ncbi:F0F1 ATP synthase subunit delta [Patescibacteria group bacterium]|nr:F0F1 ATP synthase subunit delta [Patescibacteria group bacterium]
MYRLPEKVRAFLLESSSVEQESALASLRELERAWRMDPIVRRFLTNEAIPLDERLRLIQHVGFLADNRARSLVKEWLEQGAMPKIAEFLQEAKRLRARYGAAKEVQVVSARPLESTQKADLLKALVGRWNQTVILEERVDPQVIGGLRLTTDDWFFDATIQGRIARLERELASPSSTYA